jgi:isovaleryl-CoA dehydrogenase
MSELPAAVERVRGVARQVAAEAVAPEAERVDREARWPEHSIRALGDAGLLGLHVPERLGGLGLGYQALAVTTEEVGAVCGSSGLVYGMHCVGTAVIAAKPGPDHEERFLRPIAAGRHITTLALSEPGTGVHFYLPGTRYTRDGDAFRLDGEKSFVTSGGHADSYVLSVVAAGAEQDPGSFSTVLMERDTPGVEWGAPWDGLGMRGNSSRSAALQGARVPAANLLGEVGDETWYVFEVVAPYFITAMAGVYLGIARGAVEEAVRHLSGRRYSHTGEAAGAADVLCHRVGALWTTVERSRQLLYHAAHLADAGASEARPALFAAKAEVVDAAVSATNEAMTLAGGLAYGRSARLGRALRDARAGHVMSPTTDLLKTWLGRLLLGQPLL